MMVFKSPMTRVHRGSRLAARVVALSVALVPLFGFVPFEHDGVMVLPTESGELEGRALFSTSAAQGEHDVLIRADFPLAQGGEGYLTIRMNLAPVGRVATASFDYYEKVSADLVSFDATSATGTVVVRDRFQTSTETSLFIEFDLEFTDGQHTRSFTSGYAMTAPSPAVLRGSGALPAGVVATVGTQAGGRYSRGTIDCFGEPDDVVYVGGYDYYTEEVIEEEEIIVIIDDDESTDYDDVDDDDYDYDYEWEDSDYDYTDDSGFGCSDDDSTGSTDDTTDSSTDDGGFECQGDAEAAPLASASFWRAPVRRSGAAVQNLATRVLQLSPMLLAIALLLLLRRPRAREE